MNEKIQIYFADAAATMLETGKRLEKEIAETVKLFAKSLESGGTIFWCGNGGSASDSQHLAAELIGKFKLERAPLRSLALTTDTSVITATGNDFGYQEVFSRQIEGIGRAGDVLVGITTSGQSKNVICALEKAKSLKISTVALTGNTPSILWEIADISLSIPSVETSHIQEGHIAIGQLICGMVEQHFFD